METWQWILIVVIALLVVAIIPYLIMKYGFRKPMPNVMSYLFMMFMFWTWVFTIYETSRKRREKLKKAGVIRVRKEGAVAGASVCTLRERVHVTAAHRLPT